MRDAETDDYIEVSGAIPETAAGETLIVTHADSSVQAYEALKVVPISGNGTRIYVREEVGFELTDDGKTKTTCYPQRTIEGTPKGYELLNAVHWYGEDPR